VHPTTVLSEINPEETQGEEQGEPEEKNKYEGRAQTYRKLLSKAQHHPGCH